MLLHHVYQGTREFFTRLEETVSRINHSYAFLRVAINFRNDSLSIVTDICSRLTVLSDSSHTIYRQRNENRAENPSELSFAFPWFPLIRRPTLDLINQQRNILFEYQQTKKYKTKTVRHHETSLIYLVTSVVKNSREISGCN